MSTKITAQVVCARSDLVRSPSWYRNAGRAVYHQAAPGWVRSGRAVCGADIRNPAYVADSAAAVNQHGVCKRCVKHQAPKETSR